MQSCWKYKPHQFQHVISSSYRVGNLSGKWKRRAIKVCVSVFVCMSAQSRSFRIKSPACQWDKGWLQFYGLNKLAIQRRNAHTHTQWAELKNVQLLWSKLSWIENVWRENKEREFNTGELHTFQSRALLQRYDTWSKICLQ